MNLSKKQGQKGVPFQFLSDLSKAFQTVPFNDFIVNTLKNGSFPGFRGEGYPKKLFFLLTAFSKGRKINRNNEGDTTKTQVTTAKYHPSTAPFLPISPRPPLKPHLNTPKYLARGSGMQVEIKEA